MTVGLLISGPFAGAAAASAGALFGALYDKGYISFSEDGLEFDVGGSSRSIDPVEEAEIIDPLTEFDDKWYRPDSDNYVIAIELPGGERRYYQTEEGAANRLISEYAS